MHTGPWVKTLSIKANLCKEDHSFNFILPLFDGCSAFSLLQNGQIIEEVFKSENIAFFLKFINS